MPKQDDVFVGSQMDGIVDAPSPKGNDWGGTKGGYSIPSGRKMTPYKLDEVTTVSLGNDPGIGGTPSVSEFVGGGVRSALVDLPILGSK